MRLIPISVTEELINSTNKIIFILYLIPGYTRKCSLIITVRKVMINMAPILLSSMNPEDYLEIDNHLVEEIIQI